MARIIIGTEENKIIETEGKLTFESFKDDNGEIQTRGQLAIHEYIEDIDKIETARYLLEGVSVYREVFGSEDFNILYEFEIGEGFDVIVKEEGLSDVRIKAIKKEEYKDEDSKKWESDYEWMLEMK